jgi:hypothetical protein
LVWDGWEHAVDITLKIEDYEEVPAVLDDLVAFQTATEDMIGPSRYGLMPKDELVRLCRHYGLKVSANKGSLIERLRAREDQGQDEGQDEGAEVWLRSTYWWEALGPAMVSIGGLPQSTRPNGLSYFR